MEVQLNLEEIGKRLRRLREEKGITQSKLSEEFRCKGEYRHYEKGKQLLNIDRLLDYVRFLMYQQLYSIRQRTTEFRKFIW